MYLESWKTKSGLTLLEYVDTVDFKYVHLGVRYVD